MQSLGTGGKGSPGKEKVPPKKRTYLEEKGWQLEGWEGGLCSIKKKGPPKRKRREPRRCVKKGTEVLKKKKGVFVKTYICTLQEEIAVGGGGGMEKTGGPSPRKQ